MSRAGVRTLLSRLAPARLLVALTRIAVRRPASTLAVSLLLAAAGAAAATSLEMKTSNLDLIDSRLAPVVDFRDFAHAFGTPNSLVVVLRGRDPAALETAGTALAPRLRRLPGVARVHARLPISPALARLAGLDRFFRSFEGDLLFLFVQPADPDSRAAELAPFARAVRGAIAEMHLERRGITVGFTGLPQYALDDREIIGRDLARLTALSFAAVCVLFLAAFAAPRRPLLAMLALSLAMAAVVGAAALWPGHLTLLSAFFASILLGLGVDHGIHLADRVEELARAGRGERAALVAAMEALAPGLATGTITTALAFLSLTLSGFSGFAELGWITGLGLLVCLLATATTLPAALVLLPPGPASATARARWAPALLRRLQHPAIATSLVAACLLGPALAGLPGFDGDYLALQPRASEAARLEREMVRRSRWSPQFAAFVAPDRASAERLAARLYREPLVAQVRWAEDLELGGGSESSEARELRRSFVDARGRFAVYAYPQQNVWEPRHQRDFVSRMRAIDPHVTGMPVLGRFMVERSRQALRWAGTATAVLLVACVLADFRRPGWAALALLPTVLAVPGLLAAMRLLGIDFNPISLMALPVVLGTAEDYGVHLVHRYRQEEGDLRRALTGTGRGVLLTGGTTLAGFASLCLATHRGLAGFGAVLTLGVGLSLLLSVAVLPAALRRAGPRLLAREAAASAGAAPPRRPAELPSALERT